MSNVFAFSELTEAGFDADAVERIRTILGRSVEGDAEPVLAGPVRIDPRTRRVTVDGRRVLLAQKEYELLCALAREPDRVYTKEELLRSVWGFRNGCRTRTLDSHASRLRRKLRGAGLGSPLVVNVWGVGYRLID